MSANDLTIGECVTVGQRLQGQGAIIGGYLLTTPFVAVLDTQVGELLAVRDAPKVVPVGRAEQLRAADQGVDRPLGQFQRTIDLLEEVFPEEQDLWDRLQAGVLPRGLRAVVHSSLPNEVGEMRRLESHLASDEALRRDLSGVSLHTLTLLGLVQRAIDGSKVLDGVLNTPDAPVPEETETERAVKGRFVLLLKALRDAARLAGWSADHTTAVFDPVDAAIAEATRRARAERAKRLAAQSGAPG